MTYLRYIVYRNPQKPDKQVAFWVDDIIHATYARIHGISPTNFLSAGYMRPYWGKWIPYEHYQLDDGKPSADKALVRKEFLKYPELQTQRLMHEINQTFRAEKRILRNLLFSALKKLICSRTRE